jgi:FlaA1/EpsC-like NDP-sugar epimerase
MIRKANKAAQLVLERRTWVSAIVQVAFISCSLLMAWMLRFDFSIPQRRVLLMALPVLVVVRMLAIAQCNLLHGWWRYTGLSDAIDIGKAVLAGSAAFFLIFHYLLGVLAFPLSVYLLETLLTFVILCGVRLFSRVLAESVREDNTCKTVVLVGAGMAAHMIVRELNHSSSGYRVVGCVDDDPSKRKLRILGVPVLGTVDQLPEATAAIGADEILISVPSATVSQMRRFVQICEQTGLCFKTVPSIRDLVSGEARLTQVREVRLEDLLGREPVCLDLELVRRHIAGKVVMVTGAAGSIGSELCRQIIDYGPAQLLCVDHSETGIFYLERELSKKTHGNRVSYSVADIRNSERMRKLFSACQVSIVFHAAAYKHVPVMEANVQEAVANNVFGLLHLLGISEQHGCETFVLISSDKAVNPTSIMGSTKRIGELILSAWPANGMRCVSVRFGNVLGSSGSVIPVFREQLKKGQPLTITHPEIKRFFMTITEAVSLVLQAFVIGRHGEILVLDMGEPVKILDLAHALVRLSGKSTDQVEFVFTGLRPGEKLVEELFYQYERVLPSTCEKIRRTERVMIGWPDLKRELDELRASMSVDGPRPVRTKLKQIVSDYAIASMKPVPGAQGIEIINRLGR